MIYSAKHKLKPHSTGAEQEGNHSEPLGSHSYSVNHICLEDLSCPQTSNGIGAPYLSGIFPINSLSKDRAIPTLEYEIL